MSSIQSEVNQKVSPLAQEVLRDLTAFNVDVKSSVDNEPIQDSILAVANNLISRGLPTLPSLQVERSIVEETGLTEEHISKGSIRFPFCGDLSKQDPSLLRRALCPIQSNYPPVQAALDQKHGLHKDAEFPFLHSGLSSICPDWFVQCVDIQRDLTTIVDEDVANQFDRQHVDFAIQFPSAPGYPKGLVIEIDGRQHLESGQAALDQKRNLACERAGWTYLRIPAASATNPPSEARETIARYIEHPYGKILERNYVNPVWTSERGRAWTLAALLPLHVSRIHKTLVHLLLEGHLSLADSSWSIAVLDRDLPGTQLAIADFKNLLDALFTLEGKGRSLPEIDLTIHRAFSNEEDVLALHDEDAVTRDELEAALADADLLFDTSVFLRSGLRPTPGALRAAASSRTVLATIRSGRGLKKPFRITPGDPIEYNIPSPPTPADADNHRGLGDEEAKEEPAFQALLYLLRTLFRKDSFRPDQVDILHESLRGHDVIGLLPTGAGKSLTYQMSALLQPGLTLVVSPLKSLMHDQVANLRRAFIDQVQFIDSTLDTTERVQAQKALKEGQYHMAFIAPERLQIQKFRDYLSTLDVPVAYCVVDEAHCVSEWGHDFRTAYLQLGENARNHCESRWNGDLPILALTGTASFDVLADVRRELQFGDETTTVTPRSMERKELRFEIVQVPRPDVDASASPWDIKKAVFEQKKKALLRVLKDMPTWPFDGHRPPSDAPPPENAKKTPPSSAQHNSLTEPEPNVADVEARAENGAGFFALQGDETNAGLVFTPHANGAFGVDSIAADMRRAVAGGVGRFASSNRSQDNEDLSKTQERYKEDEMTALVATKAFGMGIDKPNIRYVVHMNMSQSIESYYQQAGRAGRDRELARCVILYSGLEESDEEAISTDLELLQFFHNSSFKGPEKEKRIVYDLLTGDARPDVAGAPDLQALVKSISPGDPTQVVAINFANNELIGTMTRYLQQNADAGFTDAMVRLACDKASKAEEIAKKLKWAYKEKTRGDWPNYGSVEKHEKWLSTRFQRLRDEQDTFRAVYRLSTVGLIRDYTVDYNAGVIRAEIQNLGTAGFIETVQDYIGRYVSPERTLEVPEKILDHPGQNVLQKCIGYVIDFVYSQIARKRRMAMQTMEEAIQAGIQQGDAEFRMRVNTYFDSRYLPELQKQISDRDFSLDLVWKYIEETEGVDDNVNHLRGACDRLLSEYTENGALYLLRAFTRCLMDGGSYEAFISDFRRGWDLFAELKGMSRENRLQSLRTYQHMLVQYDTRLEGVISEEIAHVHADWVQDFNASFLRT